MIFKIKKLLCLVFSEPARLKFTQSSYSSCLQFSPLRFRRWWRRQPWRQKWNFARLRDRPRFRPCWQKCNSDRLRDRPLRFRRRPWWQKWIFLTVSFFYDIQWLVHNDDDIFMKRPTPFFIVETLRKRRYWIFSGELGFLHPTTAANQNKLKLVFVE